MRARKCSGILGNARDEFSATRDGCSGMLGNARNAQHNNCRDETLITCVSIHAAFKLPATKTCVIWYTHAQKKNSAAHSPGCLARHRVPEVVSVRHRSSARARVQMVRLGMFSREHLLAYLVSEVKD